MQVPPLPPSLAEPPVPRPVTDHEPDLIPPTGKQLPRIMFPENEGPVEEPSPVLPTSPVPRQLGPESDDATRISLSDATDVATDVETDSTPKALGQLEGELERLGDLDLIRRLSSPDPPVVQAVEKQLASGDSATRNSNSDGVWPAPIRRFAANWPPRFRKRHLPADGCFGSATISIRQCVNWRSR